MESREPSSSGLLGSLRGFVDGLLGSAHDRIQLVSLELQEEKLRLVQILFWIAAIVFLAVVGTIFASLALLIIFWETARVTVVLSLAAVYIAALIAVVVGFRAYMKRQPKPFAATLDELRSDRECLQNKS